MSQLPRPIASARIVRGVTTNRVQRAPLPPHDPGVPDTKARYKADRSRGRFIDPTIPRDTSETVIITVSLSRDELATIDAAAAKAKMSRSHFMRAGARLLAADQEES